MTYPADLEWWQVSLALTIGKPAYISKVSNSCHGPVLTNLLGRMIIHNRSMICAAFSSPFRSMHFPIGPSVSFQWHNWFNFELWSGPGHCGLSDYCSHSTLGVSVPKQCWENLRSFRAALVCHSISVAVPVKSFSLLRYQTQRHSVIFLQRRFICDDVPESLPDCHGRPPLLNRVTDVFRVLAISVMVKDVGPSVARPRVSLFYKQKR